MNAAVMVLLLIASFFGGVSVRKLPVFDDCSCKRSEEKQIELSPSNSATRTVTPKGSRTRTKTGGECEFDT